MPADPGWIDVVATPIGNLGDLSPRAREVLAAADVVAAEDTRHTGAMLRQVGIDRPLLSLHEHNEARRASELVGRALRGERIALVSDAGMPLVSDPGFGLVRAAVAAGIRLQVIPGPSALLAALAVSGLPTDRFCFEGFLPQRAAARRERLRELAREPRTLVFYESPHRLLEALQDMEQAFGPDRAAVVARELTKLHETVYRDTLAGLLRIGREDANFARGELTLVVAGSPEGSEAPDDALARRLLDALSRELPPSRAAAVVAQFTGRRKAEIYALGAGRPVQEEQ